MRTARLENRNLVEAGGRLCYLHGLTNGRSGDARFALSMASKVY